MTAAQPTVDQSQPNPHWAKLPLFEGKGWRTTPFGEFAENVNERLGPADVAGEIYAGLIGLDSGNPCIRRSDKGSDVIGTKLRFRKGDLIFECGRAYQRNLAVAEKSGVCSAHATVARVGPGVVLPGFLPLLTHEGQVHEPCCRDFCRFALVHQPLERPQARAVRSPTAPPTAPQGRSPLGSG